MSITATPHAIVNSVPLETHAWKTIDEAYDRLLDTAPLRGEDLTMPGAHGARAYPRYRTVKVISLPLIVIGSVDQDGGAIADPFEGMFNHRDYLAEQLAASPDPDRGTVPMTFVRGGALPDLEGEVTFLGLVDWTVLDRINGEALVWVDLSIPAGELFETGS